MPFVLPRPEIEDQIRDEFQLAFDNLERASDTEQADAAERLKWATRRLYDYVGYGKTPKHWVRFRDSDD